jgi:hypothetical protein
VKYHRKRENLSPLSLFMSLAGWLSFTGISPFSLSLSLYLLLSL